MSDPIDSHAWFRAVRTAYSSKLLEEVEMRDFVEHLGTCTECSEFIHAFTAEDELATKAERHVPPWLLVRWHEMLPRLSGLSRAAVRAHLANCPDCREDLEFLGIPPLLEWDPVNDIPLVEGGTGRDEYPEHRVTVSRPRQATLPPSRKVARQVWTPRRALLGWAALSTAAAVVLLLRGFSTERPPSLVIPWVAPVMLRGETSHSQLHVAPGTQRIVVAVPIPVRTAAEDGVRVEAYAADGTHLLSEQVSPEELTRGSLALLLESTHPLPFGTYRVLTRFVTPAGADSTTILFDLLPTP